MWVCAVRSPGVERSSLNKKIQENVVVTSEVVCCLQSEAAASIVSGLVRFDFTGEKLNR